MSINPLNVNRFIRVLGSHWATVDLDAFHVVQAFSNAHHPILADLHHDSVINNAGFGCQAS